MGEVFLERALAGGGEAVFSPRHASREGLVAGHIAGFLQLPGVDAEVSVRRLQKTLQLVERQPLVDRQGTDDAEPQPLVDEPIEAPDGRLMAGGWRVATADC